MTNLQINRAIQILLKKYEQLKSEQDRQFWLFTRTARGKPVDPKISSALYACLGKIGELRSLLKPVVEKDDA